MCLCYLVSSLITWGFLKTKNLYTCSVVSISSKDTEMEIPLKASILGVHLSPL